MPRFVQPAVDPTLGGSTVTLAADNNVAAIVEKDSTDSPVTLATEDVAAATPQSVDDDVEIIDVEAVTDKGSKRKLKSIFNESGRDSKKTTIKKVKKRNL